MNTNQTTKAVVSVSGMAKMVGLSRQRFYQLMGSTFPSPVYDKNTQRPYYTEEMQQTCLEVRRRNCGVDGKPVLFYSKGSRPTESRPKKRMVNKAKESRYSVVVDSLKSLGLCSVSDEQVGEAIVELFPNTTKGVQESELIRAVFVHLQRQNSSDNAG